MRLILDLDGVLVDFVGGACRLHGTPDPYDDPAMLGKWNYVEVLGLDPKAFWDPMGRDFWASLDKTPECDELMSIAIGLVPMKDIAISTSPCLTPGCCEGKLDWVRRHYPELARRTFIGSDKRFLAGPETLLIDDADHNVDDFRLHGGDAILLPKVWNSRHAERGDPIVAVLRDLDTRLRR